MTRLFSAVSLTYTAFCLFARLIAADVSFNHATATTPGLTTQGCQDMLAAVVTLPGMHTFMVLYIF